MTAIVKTCACGRSYTADQWKVLPDAKVYTMENGEQQEQRNCPCGSTIVIVLAEGESQTPEPGQIWKGKRSAVRVKVVNVVYTGVGYRYVNGRQRAFVSFADFYTQFTPVTRRTS